MIRVLIPLDSEFKKYETQIKELYEKSQKNLSDPNSFSFVTKSTLFYSFFHDGTLLGAIYYFMDGGKLFLNGFASPKHHYLNLLCLKLSTTWFSCPIYAEAQNRASALCLLRCAFKRVDGKLFCLEKNKF